MTWQDLVGFVAVGAFLAVIGKGVSTLVFGGATRAGESGWRGVYYVTMWLHPVLTGGLLGAFTTLPAPTGMGSGLAGKVIWYALAGGFSPALYSAVRSVIKQRIAREEISNSMRPPARGDE
jgi:hypothetical protein